GGGRIRVARAEGLHTAESATVRTRSAPGDSERARTITRRRHQRAVPRRAVRSPAHGAPAHRSPRRHRGGSGFFLDRVRRALSGHGGGRVGNGDETTPSPGARARREPRPVWHLRSTHVLKVNSIARDAGRTGARALTSVAEPIRLHA